MPMSKLATAAALRHTSSSKDPRGSVATTVSFSFRRSAKTRRRSIYTGEPTTLTIGDDNVIREGVTIHRGTVQGQGRTVIGNHNLLMAYVHIGHDCTLGDYVIMANNASVSGHVSVGDHANFGGYAGIPQYRSIGAHSHIGGMSLVLKDVPAFVTVSGNPAGAVGLNIEGMRRRGIADDVVAALRECYRVVYGAGLTVKEALVRIEPSAQRHAEVRLFAPKYRGVALGNHSWPARGQRRLKVACSPSAFLRVSRQGICLERG